MNPTSTELQATVKERFAKIARFPDHGPARLLRNDGGNRNHWLRLVLEGNGEDSNRSAIGARVIVEAGGILQRREVISGRGYLSQSELPLTFG